MKISLFSPIYASPSQVAPEKYAFLKCTTQFFNLGQTSYEIKCRNPNGSISVIENEHKPSWVGIMLRVAAFFTIIIPVIMFIGLLIYARVNKFQIDQNLFDQLPPEIYNKILAENFYNFDLAATSKGMRERIPVELRQKKPPEIDPFMTEMIGISKKLISQIKLQNIVDLTMDPLAEWNRSEKKRKEDQEEWEKKLASLSKFP